MNFLRSGLVALGILSLCHAEINVDKLQKECNAVKADSCNDLGFAYAEGEGEQDYKTANKLFKKACDLGLGDGCFNLGISYSKGEGVQQDYKKSIELYKKACDLGSQPGCDKYKDLNEQGY